MRYTFVLMKKKEYRYRRLIINIFIGFSFGLVVPVFIGYVIDYKQRSHFVEKAILEMSFHDLDINRSASVIARHSILIDAHVEEVWDKLTLIEDWGEWQSSISSVQMDTSAHKNKLFMWTSDGIPFHSIIHTDKRYQSFGWIGTTWGAQAIHNWYFTKEGDRTKVIVEESLQGLLVSIFSDYFQSNLNASMQTNLLELKRSCEQ